MFLRIRPALDLRALQKELTGEISDIVKKQVSLHLRPLLVSDVEQALLSSHILEKVLVSIDHTSTMDASVRMETAASATTGVILEFLTRGGGTKAPSTEGILTSIVLFQSELALHASSALDGLRRAYLCGQRGIAPASPYLLKTRPIYEFIRVTLGIPMHGWENYTEFQEGIDRITIGQHVSLIHEVSGSVASVYVCVS